MRFSVPLTLAVALVVPAAADDFAPKDGMFSAVFPGKPKENTQTTKSPIGDLKVFTATFATAEGNVYMVSYTEFPAPIKDADRGPLFDAVRDGLKGKDGKLVTEKDAEIGKEKVSGKEFVIDKGKHQTRFRTAVKNARLFQVAAVGTGEFVTGKDATAFLDSLELK